MDILLKQRIVGAIVLISLAVIFIPMLLSGKSELLSRQLSSNIPPKPVYEIKRPELVELEPLVQPSFSRPESEEANQQALLDVEEPLPDAPKPVAKAKVKTSTVPAEPSSVEKQPIEKKNVVTQSSQKQSLAKQGLAKQNLEKPVVTKESKKTPPVFATGKVQPNTQLATSWVVQVGSFRQKKNATKLRDKIQKSGFTSFVSDALSDKGKVYRVRVGPELERTLADELQKKMRRKFGLDGIIVRYP